MNYLFLWQAIPNIIAIIVASFFWLSISLIATRIYLSRSNMQEAKMLARLAEGLKYILEIWFVITMLLSFTSRNILPDIILLIYFSLMYILVSRYNKVLQIASFIAKETKLDDSIKLEKYKLILKDDNRLQTPKASIWRYQIDIFWVFDALVCIGLIINFLFTNTTGMSIVSIFLSALLFVVSIQALFIPTYRLIKKHLRTVKVNEPS